MTKMLNETRILARKGYCFRCVVTVDAEELIKDLESLTFKYPSIIGDDQECFMGMESVLMKPELTPDGRMGVIIQAWGLNKQQLINEFRNFILDVILPLPTASCFDAAIRPRELIPLGKDIAAIGGIWKSKTMIEGRVTWTIPVFDGEFMIQHAFGLMEGIYRINVKIMGRGRLSTLAVVKSITKVGQEIEGIVFIPRETAKRIMYVPHDEIVPFHLAINHRYCPTLMTRVEDTKLPAGVDSVYITSLFAISKERATKTLQKIASMIENEENIIAMEFVTGNPEVGILIDLEK